MFQKLLILNEMFECVRLKYTRIICIHNGQINYWLCLYGNNNLKMKTIAA